MQACTNIDIGVIAAESIRTTVAGGFVRSRRDSASNADRDGAVTSEAKSDRTRSELRVTLVAAFAAFAV
jgi:hypothetical protein